MDIIESQHVLVSRVFAISEDDTFSTKTWDEQTDSAKHWPGSPEPLEDVIFEDCLAWSRCDINTGSAGPVRRTVLRNITVRDVPGGAARRRDQRVCHRGFV